MKKNIVMLIILASVTLAAKAMNTKDLTGQQEIKKNIRNGIQLLQERYIQKITKKSDISITCNYPECTLLAGLKCMACGTRNAPKKCGTCLSARYCNEACQTSKLAIT